MVMCILVAVTATTNLLLIPVIFIIINKDPKGTADYEIELGDDTPSLDTDEVDRYEQRIQNLQQEKQILTDKLRSIARQSSETALIGSDSSLQEGNDYSLDSPGKKKRESLL